MKTNIATTKDQSQRLLRCGVSADTADMCLSTRTRKSDGSFIAKKHQTTNLWIGYPCWRTTSGDEELDNVPAWSLSALLSLLPTSIVSSMDNEYILELSKLRMHDVWEIQWFNGRDRFSTRDKHKNYHKLWDKSPIETCVKAIEWLTASGHMLKSTT